MADISIDNNEEPHFPVVAIGASAGGIEAVAELLQNLPAKTGLAYIYIQHLDPTHESNLPTILSRQSKIPVQEAEDKMKIVPDNFYVIPANREITLVDGHLAVSIRPSKPYAHMPINRFFISLAERYKEAAVGIILSGTASDGTLGLKAIKMEGGLTFAQDDSAKFESMPKSALAEGAVDLVLSPKQMADELSKLGNQKDIYFSLLQDSKHEVISNEDEALSSILKIMNSSVGVDFSLYKMTTIRRRIVRRMMLYKITSINDYLQYLKQHSNEVKLLYDDLLINVTEFFRDTESCDYIKKEILPNIIKSKGPSEPIRVWIPACSTGQEAYSIAILIIEALGDDFPNRAVQIFATDLSENAINKARVGVYSKDELVQVSPKRLQKFFTRIDGSYRIIKSIRDLCIFASHNILKDPPFSRLDMVSCCNLMIYLDKQLQRKVLATFHYSLLEEGYLVLGKSETIGNSAYIFTQVEKKLKVFIKKRETSSRAVFDMNIKHTEHDRIVIHDKHRGIPKTGADEVDLEKAVDDLLLKKFTPASVIVTADLDIVQFRGSTGIFLEPAPGKASLNLVKMAKAGLGFDLRNLIHKAKKSGKPSKKTGLEIIHDGKNIRLNIEAVPLTAIREEYYLVIFEELLTVPASGDADAGTDKRVHMLESELSSLREDMRSIVESHEAANEELQSANEEVVSSNEELQSINEELETSKEEIESSNEELMTINQELQVRNEELAESQEYSEAIFSTIGESVAVLDKDLRVKFANKAFYQTFKVKEEETEGHLLYELGNRQWNIPPLKELLGDILENNSEVNGYEVSHEFPSLGHKIMRINAKKLQQRSSRHPLIIISFQDVTEFHMARKRVDDGNMGEYLMNISNNFPGMIWLTDKDMRCNFVNKSWMEFTGLSWDQSIGGSWIQVVHPEDMENCASIFNSAFKNKVPFDLRCRLRFKDSKYKKMLVKGKPDFDETNNFKGFVGTCIET